MKTSSRKTILIVLAMALLQVGPTIRAQTASGIVVEQVTKDSQAERAGIRDGDVIMNWARSDSKGEIGSPFDLSWIEIEEAPRGEVTLEGLRGMEKKTWILATSRWGIKTRPQMSDSQLLIYRQGQEMAKAGKSAEAAEHWKQAAGQTKGLTRIWVLYQTAHMWTDARRWAEADKAYQETVDAAASGDPASRAQLFESWGDAYLSRSDWKNAEACYQNAVAEAQKLGGENLSIAKSLNNLGTISRRRGDLAQAEEYHRQALEISQKLAPGSLDVATSFNNFGLVYLNRGDLAKAEKECLQALEIRQKLAPGSLDVAASFNNLGLVAQDRGDLAKAEEYHLQALEIKQKLAPGSLDVAASFNNLGNVADLLGDLAKAEEYHRQALDIRQKLVPGSLDVAASFNNLGVVAWRRGDLAKEEEYHLQALEIRQKLAPGSLDVAASFNNLGNVARIRGDLAKAEEYLRQALEIRQKLAPGSLAVAFAFDNLGVVARERSDLVKAEEYHHRALDIEQKLAPGGLDAAESFDNLGVVARQRGDLVKAQEYYRQALEIQQKLAPESMDAADTYNNLGDLARDQKDLTRALEYYRQAVTIRGKLAPESQKHAESLASLAGVIRHKGEPDSAAPLYEQALHAFESQTAHFGGAEETRSNFRAAHSNYFLDYIDLLMLEKKPDLAFHVAERWRAGSLLEMLAAAEVDIHQGINPELHARERSLQELLRAKSDRRITLLTAEHIDEKQVAEVEKEISNFRSEYDDLEGRIRATSPVYAALTHPQPLSVTETQKLLDDDTVLLEYSLGEERSYVWTITRDSLRGYELPSNSKIENPARQLRQLVSSPTKASPAIQARLQATAAALSRMVLAPVAAEITGKRLLIVSDGTLQYVPFAILPVPGNAKGVPLIVEHEIVYAPSASVLAELRRETAGRTQAPKAVAVLADPVFDKSDPRIVRTGQNRDPKRTTAKQTGSSPNDRLTRSVTDVGLSDLPRLAFSRREAEAIMAVTPTGQGKKALGFEANRPTATSPELGQYRIVHFATHALLDSKRPELSGLVLSLVDRHGKAQNGFLDLQDIYNLNLHADMVVLSACETGLGKEIRGEGLIGLTRGFMYAGAVRVLASLWKVDDVATAELMARFYKAMEQQGLRPAAALRQAQIEMWRQKRWAAPYHWAGFQLQGEWK